MCQLVTNIVVRLKQTIMTKSKEFKNSEMSEEEIGNIRKQINNDLASAVAFFNMVRSDPEMMRVIEDRVIENFLANQENQKIKENAIVD